MTALLKLATVSHTWRRTAGPGPVYRLDAQEGAVATLAFDPADATLARVETADGAWTLRHSRFPDSAVTLRVAGTGTDLARFHPHVVGLGKLAFAGGETFEWLRLEGIHPGGAFQDADGLPLVHLSLAPDGTSRTAPEEVPLAQVDVARPHRHPADPALLASVGWYLLLLETLLEDSGVAAETSLRM